jgi:hypothetical protein
MSLVRLLTSGRSLVGGQSSPHRFRVNRHVALPKFNSAKNPFASEAQQQRAEARATAAFPTEAKSGRATNAPAPPAALRKPRAARAIEWFGELGRKLSPFALLKRKPRAASTAEARAGAPAVQAELSLDAVRVLRNDLSDADGETIPPLPKPATLRSATIGVVTARAEAVGQAMDRMSSKFFGVHAD